MERFIINNKEEQGRIGGCKMPLLSCVRPLFRMKMSVIHTNKRLVLAPWQKATRKRSFIPHKQPSLGFIQVPK